MNRPLARIALAALLLGACTSIVLGFFLPWMEGSNELDHRSFSGFDFARLIRNFEITAASESETGRIRAAALILYLMPALAVNAAILAALSWTIGVSNRVAGAAVIAAGVYGQVVLGALLFLSVVQVNDFAGVVGAPRYGFVVSALGCAVLLGVGLARPPYRHATRS